MKTDHVTRYFRNRESSASKLAAWQATPAARRLTYLRGLASYAGDTIAARRAYALASFCPVELSAPFADSPLLWLGDLDRSPLVSRSWEGRDFLTHRGWFTDDDCQDETIEAVAVELVDFPGLIFEGTRESCSGDSMIRLESAWEIDFREASCEWEADDCRKETAKDAIRSADSTAERMAEEERDYQAEQRRERDLEEAKEELASLRGEIRALCRELKTLCPLPLATDFPAAAKACKDRLKSLLVTRSRTLETLAELRDA